MGFLNKLLSGASKVGRFVGKVSNVVGNVAGALSNVPVIGGVASSVAKVANTVNKVANVATGLIDKGQEIANSNKSTMGKIADAATAVYKTGIPDKLTGGKVSQVVNTVKTGVNAAKQGIAAANQAAQGGGPPGALQGRRV